MVAPKCTVRRWQPRWRRTGGSASASPRITAVRAAPSQICSSFLRRPGTYGPPSSPIRRPPLWAPGTAASAAKRRRTRSSRASRAGASSLSASPSPAQDLTCRRSGSGRPAPRRGTSSVARRPGAPAPTRRITSWSWLAPRAPAPTACPPSWCPRRRRASKCAASPRSWDGSSTRSTSRTVRCPRPR